MSDEILINVTPSEARVALVENGLLQEIYLERVSQDSYLGNIYKGKVSRVLPGMQAAFIEIGLSRTAFLHVSDIIRKSPEIEETTDAAEETPEPQISDLVRDGEEVVVQVIKDPLGTKGARLTTNVSIPSRYLVFLPGTESIGVSVRIDEEGERDRLRAMMVDLCGSEHEHGYIVRTNADGVEAHALATDKVFLGRLWQDIQERIRQAVPGDCVYDDLSLPVRAMRDLMHVDIEKVRIDDLEVTNQVRRFIHRFIPDWLDRVEFYSNERPIFDLYGVEDELERALVSTVSLKSGGYLVIDQTEAMTTIDVNTGSYTGHRNLEETVYKTNLEATEAIARQLRLRNLGGIIIVDFIDMLTEQHRDMVLATLKRALSRDNAKFTVSDITPLGLVEMTRKRTIESLEHRLCVPCPTCEGRGVIKSAETVSLEIIREIMRSGRQFEASKIMVMASSAVVDVILDEQSTTVADLEEILGKSIHFQREDQYGQETYDVVLL
ncbi:MAG: ribonuclease G [Xanthomonadales bacterium]|nr:ribonuclease G [Xanthomonadales bacterium]